MSSALISRVAVGALAMATLAACSVSDLVNNTDLPANIQDPGIIKTPDGALGLYYTAVSSAATAFGGGGSTTSFIEASGLLTDELRTAGNSNFPTSGAQAIDSRTVPNNDYSANGKTRMTMAQAVYRNLQRVRGNTNEAIGALAKYAPAASPALRGHAYALQGLADVMLAELYCSGIPLSTLDFEKGYTLAPGSTSEQVYTAALALFDSADKYSADSARFVLLAKMGRARALLALDRYADARAAVADVPTDYQYAFSYSADSYFPNLFRADPSYWTNSVADQDGGNGLPYITSADPRSKSFKLSGVPNPGGLNDRWFPSAYATTYGNAPIVFASGLEARLIDAEAALAAGDGTWLATLNALRTTCATAAGCPTPAPAGEGGVTGLPPLNDPGTDAARVTLLFNERAYWLFLSGHRQGDLRRLVRQYHRLPQTVYPAGFWGLGVSPFGDAVSLPLPVDEQIDNPLYKGCISREA